MDKEEIIPNYSYGQLPPMTGESIPYNEAVRLREEFKNASIKEIGVIGLKSQEQETFRLLISLLGVLNRDNAGVVDMKTYNLIISKITPFIERINI